MHGVVAKAEVLLIVYITKRDRRKVSLALSKAYSKQESRRPASVQCQGQMLIETIVITIDFTVYYRCIIRLSMEDLYVIQFSSKVRSPDPQNVSRTI